MRDFVQAFGPQLRIFHYLVLVRSKTKNWRTFFFQENSDFPCLPVYALVKIIFSYNSLFVNRFSNFLLHFLGVFGCKRIIRSYFAGGVSEQGDIQKRQFPKDGIRRVARNDLVYTFICVWSMKYYHNQLFAVLLVDGEYQ